MSIDQVATRCRACRRNTGTDLCRWCQQTCRRKRRFPSYQQARDVLAMERLHHWDDPTLRVYQCPAHDDGHYHLGHATGQEAKRLRKRAEKFRRKALVRDLEIG